MLVNDALVRVAEGKLQYLIVMWPPRHGKSELISKHAPAWFVGRYGKKVVASSYEATLAWSFSAHARNIIRDYGPEVFGVSLGEKRTEAWWEASNGGAMMSTGVGGPITGKGGDVLMIDDPTKNSQEAYSPVIQKRNQDWYDATWQTRVQSEHTAEILTGTRWHDDDLIGYVLSKGDKPWTVIKLPALAEDNDPLGRERGEALCPQMYDRDYLLRMKGSMSSAWWNALYQQNPQTEEGTLFKREYWQRYRTMPATATRGCITIDTAGWTKPAADGHDSDHGVISVWRTDGLNFYVKDVYRGRWEFPDFLRRVKDVREREQVPVVIESTPWAQPLIQTLRDAIPGVISFENMGRSKENRAQAVIHYAEGMNLWLPETGEWVSDFIDEHASFPHGSHDDMVDTTTMALHYLGRGVGQRQDSRANVNRYRQTIGRARA